MLLERIQMEPDEEILTIVRKHWFIITAELLGLFLVLILPFILLGFIGSFSPFLDLLPFNIAEHTNEIGFFIIAWALMVLMSAFSVWTHYYLDLWVITDRRIIVIDQIHFFNRNVSIFHLERLQDIEFIIKGVIPTLLNFGTLRAQTAGAHESNFSTNGLPDPRSLQAMIQKAMDDRLHELHITPDEIH